MLILWLSFDFLGVLDFDLLINGTLNCRFYACRVLVTHLLQALLYDSIYQRRFFARVINYLKSYFEII